MVAIHLQYKRNKSTRALLDNYYMYVNFVVVMHRFLVNYFIHSGRMSVCTAYFELNFVWEVRVFNLQLSVASALSP